MPVLTETVNPTESLSSWDRDPVEVVAEFIEWHRNLCDGFNSIPSGNGNGHTKGYGKP